MSRNISMNRISDDFEIGRTKLRNFERGKEEVPSPDAKAMASLLASGQMHNPPLNTAQMFDVLLGYSNEEGERSPLVEEIARIAASKSPEQQRMVLQLLQGNINDSSAVNKDHIVTVNGYDSDQRRKIRLLLEKKGLVDWILQHANLLSKWLIADKEGFTYFLQRYRTFKKLRECAKELSSSFVGGADKPAFEGKYFKEIK